MISEITLHTLTVRELHERLQSTVAISYSSLSELLNAGDIAQQLRIEGGGNARRILPDVVTILAQFLPLYREKKGRLGQAPDMLRAFLAQNLETPAGALAVSEFRATPEPDALEIARAQGRAAGLAQAERVLTAKEAAAVLHLSVRQLRQTTKPWRRFGKSPAGDRWRYSDLVA